MSYRTRNSSDGISVTFILALVGSGILCIGLLSLLLVLYVFGAVTEITAQSGGEFSQLVVEPLLSLYYGGVVTLSAGGFLMIISTAFLVHSMSSITVD